MTDVRPLAALIGAELGSASVPQPLDDFDTISAALAQHRVLVLPGQWLDAVALRTFVARFGPLHTHHADEGVLPAADAPEVLQMRKEPDGAKLFGGEGWHADVTFLEPAGLVSALSAIDIPPMGGDTLFANTVAAFDALSPAMQEMLRGLRGVHNYDGPGRPDRPGLTAVHPVVRTHPDTGAEGLYVNTMFVGRFEGMTEDESRPLIEFLERHVTSPEFVCRVTWEAGHLVLWDNRFTLHYPINDFTGHARLLLRCVALEGP